MCSRGYPTNSNKEEFEGDNDDAIDTSKLLLTQKCGRSDMKKHVELDGQRKLLELLKVALCNDIKKYTNSRMLNNSSIGGES